MTLTIQQLRHKWNTEKAAYRECEVGSGTQKFVKNMLMAEQLFAIKEGLLTTPLEWREYEFVEEQSKKGRHADVVIYSFSDTIIPVEIERYGNIKAGVKQLLQYQADWDKKYGILTDGFEWRFYNNNIYRSFFLNDILEEPETFLTFWREYLKPENYYLSLFEEQNQLSLFKELTHLPVDSNREVFFDDITHLIKSLRLKLKLEGYFLQYEGKKLEKATVEITYAYIIQFILYRAGSANSDRGLSGGSVLWQPKMAEKRRTDEQTSTQEPFGDVQGQGGFGGDPGREDFGRTGRAD